MPKTIAYIPQQPIVTSLTASDAGYVRLFRNSDGAIYERTDAATNRIAGRTFANVLTTAQTINSATLTTVTGWTWTVGAGETWIIDAMLIAAVNAIPDMIMQIQSPAGSSGRYSLSSIDSGTVGHGVFGPVASATPTVTLTTANDTLLIKGGCITVAAGSITVQIRNSAGATAQTIQPGSWIRAERIA